MARIYPSLISADLLNLEKTIKILDPACDGYHIDIMDNHFVPNLTWGAQFGNAIAQVTTKQIWVHLMVTNPRSIIDHLQLKKGSLVSFHVEAAVDHKALIDCIHQKGWKASMAISPKTPAKTLHPFLAFIDQALVMSVEPGRSGQPFVPSALATLTALVDYKTEHHLALSIGLDGGINATNIVELVHAGAQELAVASGIFGHPNPLQALEQLKKLCA